MEYDVIVVGGGGAGMMAAITAAKNNARVLLLEHNEKLGKKLFITGKGRCNITNAADIDELFDNIITNPKFLFSAIYGFDNQAVMDFFEEAGLKIKTERGNRVFPMSDHSSDVIRTLDNLLRKYNVEVLLNTEVSEIVTRDDKAIGVKTSKNKTFEAESVIIATGGVSYKTTGSTGDGHRWAEMTGHRVTDLRPALVPFNIKEEEAKRLQGLSLKNVGIKITDGKRKLYEDFGEMLFTHFGVSGPLILSASSVVGKHLKKGELKLSIDLKSALDEETLDKRILREFTENSNKNFENAISSMFPSKLLPIIVEKSGIDPYKKANSVTREERQTLLKLIKNFELTIISLRDFNEAIITSGGVSVKDINPSTMESKHIEGLYFAGELIDVDALTGGFNLQIAWSTGYLAGLSAVERTRI